MAAPILADISGATGWVADYHASVPPQEHDIAGLSSALNSVLGAELAGAQTALGATAEEILLAALIRAIARTVGDGVLNVELSDGWSGQRQVTVPCLAQRDLTSPELLAGARSALEGEPRPAMGTAEVLLSHGVAPAHNPDTGHLLGLYVHRDADFADVLYLDWRYDTRSFERSTVEELSEQFPLALIEITSG